MFCLPIGFTDKIYPDIGTIGYEIHNIGYRTIPSAGIIIRIDFVTLIFRFSLIFHTVRFLYAKIT